MHHLQQLLVWVCLLLERQRHLKLVAAARLGLLWRHLLLVLAVVAGLRVFAGQRSTHAAAARCPEEPATRPCTALPQAGATGALWCGAVCGVCKAERSVSHCCLVQLLHESVASQAPQSTHRHTWPHVAHASDQSLCICDGHHVCQHLRAVPAFAAAAAVVATLAFESCCCAAAGALSQRCCQQVMFVLVHQQHTQSGCRSLPVVVGGGGAAAGRQTQTWPQS